VIVFVSFIFAFTGPWKRSIVFVVGGTLVIYVMNLVRIVLLFEVAYYFPDQLFFFHKFLFTGFIYSVVFVMWFIWVRKFKAV
jgi:exosortase family protein XrtF